MRRVSGSRCLPLTLGEEVIQHTRQLQRSADSTFLSSKKETQRNSAGSVSENAGM